MNGFEQFSPAINGFGELCWCSWDEWKVGIGGIAGMQFTVFELSAFLCVAEGNCINSFWFKVGVGDVRTDVCILDTSSWKDRSSKGSLLSRGSGLVTYVPLGFSCKGNNVLRNHSWFQVIPTSPFLTHQLKLQPNFVLTRTETTAWIPCLMKSLQVVKYHFLPSVVEAAGTYFLQATIPAKSESWIRKCLGNATVF